ncbi:unnamed protein product [Symbiodinium sp. CCMP2456]|nr:unnamed protein product [Symbiodinium sp. CCMP2456]
MIAPCLAGNLVGTIMNQLFPSVVIMVLLLLLVSCTFSTSARRALNMWHAENESRCALQASRAVPADTSRADPSVIGKETASTAPNEEASISSAAHETEEEDPPYTQVSFFSDSSMKDTSQTLTRRRNPTILPLSASGTTPGQEADATSNESSALSETVYTWGKFVLVWLCMILIVALRGGHGHSIVSISSCSWEYWLVTGIGFLVLILFGALAQRPEAPWYMCLVVGALSAVVGIGGAIVLNPMMVKRGIEVPAATATASLMVLVMSSCSTSLFVLGGFVPLLPAVTFGIASFLGSLCGKTVVSVLVSWTGRTSLLVILLSIFIAVSGVTVFCQGVLQTVEDFRKGENPLTDWHLPC